VVKIDAATYPVTMIYDPPVIAPDTAPGSQIALEALLDKVASITERVVSENGPGAVESGGGGDILIFLSGEKMIKDCMSRLAMGPVGSYLHLIPLYGRLGKDEQERVFEAAPRGKTKVVISTNIAETSVTIDGITAVIDSGLSKLSYYNPRTFTASLVEGPISKASANQRKGRAGRTREGTCYRLYARKDFENRPLFTTEEIYRTDLSEVVLRMADLGVTAYEDFDFISSPGREGLVAAMETLNLLDALEPDRTLSRIGKLMTEFPLPPRQSRIIVEAILRYPNVIQETLIAAAFLSTQSPYVLPPGEDTDARKAHHSFRDPGGDFVSYLKLYRAYAEARDKGKFCEKNYLDEKTMAEIVNVSQQLEQIVSDQSIPILSGGPVEDYLCAVARGLIQFVCVREGRDMYRSLTADRILIHPGSVMFRRTAGSLDPRYIVAGEIVRTTRMYAMSVSPLSREALERISPRLLAAFGEIAGGPERDKRSQERLTRPRDFTNNIKIGNEVFAIETVKGKKQVNLPWERLARVKDSLGGRDAAGSPDNAGFYKGLRGTVVIRSKYTLLAEEKLDLILTLIPSLDIDGAFNRDWPRKRHFSSQEDLEDLLGYLPALVSPAIWKQGKKELGFLCLFTDGRGSYWFKCSRGFHTALTESMASVESLIDELGDEVDIEKKHIVNQTYRRLSDYLS
jgi:HrpA-like RNA helicase